MGFIGNIGRIRTLMAKDMNAHIGDIAVLKMDGVSMAARPEHRDAMLALGDYNPVVDLDALAAMPENSFGYAVATFMRDNDLSPFVFTDEIDADMRRRNAFGIRLAQTHDLVHVLADFGTDWPGEMGVYAVQYAQRWSVWSPVLALATMVFYPFFTFFALGDLRRAWRRGVALGQRAPFLLGERLEDQFDQPLVEVRRRYNLVDPTPVPQAA